MTALPRWYLVGGRRKSPTQEKALAGVGGSVVCLERVRVWSTMRGGVRPFVTLS